MPLCLNWAGTDPMLVASGRYRPNSGTLLVEWSMHTSVWYSFALVTDVICMMSDPTWHSYTVWPRQTKVCWVSQNIHIIFVGRWSVTISWELCIMNMTGNVSNFTGHSILLHKNMDSGVQWIHQRIFGTIASNTERVLVVLPVVFRHHVQYADDESPMFMILITSLATHKPGFKIAPSPYPHYSVKWYILIKYSFDKCAWCTCQGAVLFLSLKRLWKR